MPYVTAQLRSQTRRLVKLQLEALPPSTPFIVLMKTALEGWNDEWEGYEIPFLTKVPFERVLLEWGKAEGIETYIDYDKDEVVFTRAAT